MYAKLSKIERKLSTLDLEDLSLLEVDGAEEDYIHLLDKFVSKYGNSFRIIEFIGAEVRDMLVLKLFLKLEHLTKAVKQRKGSSSTSKQALFLICETIRICLRDPMNLGKVQTEHAFHSLLSLYVKYRHLVGIAIAISAGRCLYNILNNNEERMQWFVFDLKGSMQLDATYFLTNLIESQPSSTFRSLSTTSADSKEDGKEYEEGKDHPLDCKSDERNDDSDCKRGEDVAKVTTTSPTSSPGLSTILNSKSSLVSYSESEHTQYIQLLHYAVRIIYMMVCQSESILQYFKQHFGLMKSLVLRLAYCLTHNYDSPPKHAEALNMSNFPYTEENALLFIDISKLLYALDVYAQLESCILYSESILYVTQDHFWIDYFLQEHARHANSVTTHNASSIEEISVHLMAEFQLACQHSSIRLAEGKDDDGESYLQRNVQSYSPDYKDSKDDAESSHHPHFHHHDGSKEIEITAAELLNTVISIVLSIGPYNCNLYIQIDKHASVYYTGKLSECEEYCLQLAMLCTESFAKEIFSTISHGPHPSNLIVDMVSHRKAYLPNSIVRIMSRLLQKSKNIDASDRAALLTPVMIVATKMVKSHLHCYKATKHLLFPTPYSSEMSAATATSSKGKSNNMDPIDCPAGTMRYDLIKLMTSFDPNIKRCVAEFIFALCDDNVDEFIYRTGFGNAVALLKLKGLV